MMKERINTLTVTYHAVPNIGAFLQTYALHQTLNRMEGVCDEILDYRPVKQEAIHTREIFGNPRGIRSILVFFWGKCHQKDLKTRLDRFEKKRKRFIKLSEQCKTWEEAKTIIQRNKYDVLISGSDQIWNADLADFSLVYFFPHMKHKISYGSSLGFCISEKTLKNVRQYAGEYSYIAAREIKATEELSKIIDREIPIVLDPSLLVDKEDYLPLAKESRVPLTSGKYILFYSVICDWSVIKKAKRISEVFKLPVIAVYNGGTFRRAAREVVSWFKMDFVTDPGDFIRYIMNAEYVLTDSFHGTAMSILFHKDFLRIQEVNNGIPKKDNRIDTLLSLLNLENRTVSILSEYHPSEPIPWEIVDNTLNQLRTDSLEWLENAIRCTAEEKR